MVPVNYFIVQEFLGFLFLLINFSRFQFLIVIVKLGVSPFHFWFFRFLKDLKGLVFIWLITLQKIPFLSLMVYLGSHKIFLLTLGVVLCFLQIFLIAEVLFIIFISSTESFNWILILILVDYYRGFKLVIFYLIFMRVLIIFFSDADRDNVDWSLILILINIPLIIVFYLKVYVLRYFVFFGGFYILFLLILIFISLLSLSFILFNISINLIVLIRKHNNLFFLIFFQIIFGIF